MNRILLLLTLFLPVLASAQNMDDKIKALSTELADQIVKNGAKKVAVATFDYNGCNTAFGKYLAEEMTGYLSVSGRNITVVNQKMLESLLAQNQLTAKGLLEAKNDAAKLGQVSGIDALVYGTITTFGEDVKISANVLRMPTLTVFGFGKSGFSLTASIKEMLPCMDTPTPGATPSKSNKTTSSPKKGIPTMAADCESKNTCMICVTNGSSAPIKAALSYNGYPVYYLMPGDMKCFQTVQIYDNADHQDIEVRWNAPETNYTIKADPLVVQPCKLYEKTYTK